jgi:hypothetical protein
MKRIVLLIVKVHFNCGLSLLFIEQMEGVVATVSLELFGAEKKSFARNGLPNIRVYR